MILLRRDCLVFELSDGENVPCPVEDIAIEILGEAVSLLNEEIIRNAAASVLYYFKVEQDRTTVTLGEFTLALERVLKDLGLNVQSEPAPPVPEVPAARVAETDLGRLAAEIGKGCELFFFPRLRAELRTQLGQAPQILRFTGLRGCVKQLRGARRWSPGCQDLNDQIVEYLRTCFSAEPGKDDCSLVVH